MFTLKQTLLEHTAMFNIFVVKTGSTRHYICYDYEMKLIMTYSVKCFMGLEYGSTC